ncbi:hypothetical protein D1007_07619 [Hordeum vulgare]|nr:hypothetical protein D1007_07619 [Hordeum vulgare]
MPITSDLHWDVYKEQVDKSDDKSTELFATKVEPPRAEIDLNRLVSSPMTERTSVPFVEQRIMIDASNAYSQPPTSKESEVELHSPNACCPPPVSQANEVDVIASEEVIQKDGDVDGDGDFDEAEEGFHGIDVGDLDAYIAQNEMDRKPRDEDEDENAYLKKGVKFPTLAAKKLWLSDYAIRNHRPFYVEHSDINL